MTPEQRAKTEHAIRQFHERAAGARDVLDSLDNVLSLTPESPLFEAMWALVGGYIEALGASFHIDGWMEWWWSECLLGEKPMKAGLPGQELREIATVDDLVQLVLADLELVTQ